MFSLLLFLMAAVLVDWACRWPILRRLMVLQFGIYGGLRPPMYGCRCYWIRLPWWRLMNSVYTLSGVPELWREWMKEEGD